MRLTSALLVPCGLMFVSITPLLANPTIAQIASRDQHFSTLVAALKAAGLVDALNGKGNFMVFAPTNDAFAALPKGTVATLLKPKNRGKLTSSLLYHVLAKRVPAAAIPQDTINVATLNGKFRSHR